jgi:RNA polymerase sigma-70 factor (ECF subfamily)
MSRSPDQGPIDAELLGRLLDEYGPGLALYAAQWTQAADDCVQEALVELARQPVVPENLRAWLYRVVKHRALNAARGGRRRQVREARTITDRLTGGPERNTFDRCDVLALGEALQRLKTLEREVVVMRIWGGLTYEEIAVAQSISTSSAHRTYERALESLRQILESPCLKDEKPEGSN